MTNAPSDAVRGASQTASVTAEHRANPTEVRAPSMATFDYSSGAELFPSRRRKFRHQPITYKRFAQAADAIRFAIEELPPELLLGAYLEVDEERYDSEGIRRLYESAAYPLARPAAASA
jgi:hypothetical protein